MDRRSGTGRGREIAKGGHGKGNLGTANDEVKLGEEVGENQEVKNVEVVGEEGQTPAEETTEAQPEEKEVKKQEEEEEEKGFTLNEYLAQKKKANFKKEARKPEELKKTGIEKVEKTEGVRVEGISNKLK